MHNKFPQPEVPTFECYYGESHKDAHPVSNPVTHNLKQTYNTPYSDTEILIPPYAAWFDSSMINEIEINAFPTFFIDDISSSVYKEWRNNLINMFRETPYKRLSVQNARKRINCDIVSLMRIYNFLEKWGLINYKIEELNEINTLKDTKWEFERVKIDSCPDLYTDKNIVCACGHRENIYLTEKNSQLICSICLEKGNYDLNCTSDDYRLFNNTHYRNMWSKDEELVLIDGIDKCENWSDIALKLGKTKEQCIIRFLCLDIKTSTLAHNQSLLNENLLRSVPNPLMCFITFLCGSVNPKIASDAAKFALNHLDERELVSDELIEFTMECAKEIKNVEDANYDSYMKTLVDDQINKLEIKVSEYEELSRMVEKEKNEKAETRVAFLKENRKIN